MVVIVEEGVACCCGAVRGGAGWLQCIAPVVGVGVGEARWGKRRGGRNVSLFLRSVVWVLAGGLLVFAVA